MPKKTRGLRTGRGFGKQPILPDPELLVFQLMTTLALNMASEKLSELDATRTKEEWRDWFMEQADQRLSKVDSEEELGAIVFGKET